MGKADFKRATGKSKYIQWTYRDRRWICVSTKWIRWAKRWPACGLYGKAVPQQMISDTAKQIFSRIGIRYDDWEFQVDGQISMEAMQNEIG